MPRPASAGSAEGSTGAEAPQAPRAPLGAVSSRVLAANHVAGGVAAVKNAMQWATYILLIIALLRLNCWLQVLFIRLVVSE